VFIVFLLWNLLLLGLIDELARGVESLVVVIADIKSFSTFRRAEFRPWNRVLL
jgi:hypothetical protein